MKKIINNLKRLSCWVWCQEEERNGWNYWRSHACCGRKIVCFSYSLFNAWAVLHDLSFTWSTVWKILRSIVKQHLYKIHFVQELHLADPEKHIHFASNLLASAAIDKEIKKEKRSISKKITNIVRRRGRQNAHKKRRDKAKNWK